MERLYYGISEVAEELEVSIPTIRYWEREFPQIKPYRNTRGVRYFKKKDIDIIKQIHYLTRTCGYTLEGVKNYLKHNKNSSFESLVSSDGAEQENQEDESMTTQSLNNIEVVRTLNEIKTFLLEIKKNL